MGRLKVGKHYRRERETGLNVVRIFDVYLEMVRNCEYCLGVAVDECFSCWGCTYANKAASVIYC